MFPEIMHERKGFHSDLLLNKVFVTVVYSMPATLQVAQLLNAMLFHVNKNLFSGLIKLN